MTPFGGASEGRRRRGRLVCFGGAFAVVFLVVSEFVGAHGVKIAVKVLPLWEGGAAMRRLASIISLDYAYI